jgi:putative cardiolipin synthase
MMMFEHLSSGRIGNGIRLALTLGLLGLGACSSLPSEPAALPVQNAPAPATKGVLAGLGDSIHASHDPDISGFQLLDKSTDALTWRLALLDSAVTSLDLLYYLWFGDDSGRLLLKRVIDAADRGVQVRLVIDDLILIGKDKALAAIQQHPNIELRLFNPKHQRKLGLVVSSLVNFKQMNSRMHDKLIVADNRAVILGGRNIGDEYFGLHHRFNFHDLDVLGFGPVARQSSEMFDNIWNSKWVVSAASLPTRLSQEEAQKRRQKLLEELAVAAPLANFPVDGRDWSVEFHDLSATLHFGTSEVIYDRFEDGELIRDMVDPLGQALRSAESSVKVTNAYLIPDQDFIDGLKRMTDRGVEVSIMTNSLASHDVPAVNSQYKLWRRSLVEAGAELHELRADPGIKNRIDTPPVVSKFSGLHTKSFVVDGHIVFIGSMNFDPRSTNINTEMGIIIDSPGLGLEMLRLAERDMSPDNAWSVKVDEKGDLIWQNSDETVTRQPARGCGQRFMDWLFQLLPKSQL